MKKYWFFLFLMSLFLWNVSCEENDDPALPALILTPGDTVLLIRPGDTIRFSANREVNWTTTTGSITTGGLYLAPSNAGIYLITASTTSGDTPQNASRKVTVTPHADLFKAMQKGGYVVYFRHMTAANGSDSFQPKETDWWRSCDSTIARQLSPQGRVQGQETGSAIKNLNLPVGKVISSEFCRCTQSAESLDLKLPIETAPALTYYIYNEEDRFEQTIALAEAQPISNKITVLMAHSFTSGESAPNLQMGDAAVYKQLPGNKIELVKIIPTADWRALK
jgi:phosphohistidine phosphatase SixA